MRTCLVWYKPFLINKSLDPDELNCKREECILRLHAIIPHHCGDHSGCFEKMCGYADLKKAHGDWSVQQLEEAYAKIGRFKGKYMGLSKEGISKLEKLIFKRVDGTNLDRVALILSSNRCENFFNRCVMHSEGKQLNLDQTDQWKIMLYTVLCQASNEHFTKSLSEQIGLEEENKIQKAGRAQILREKTLSSNCLASENAKSRRRHQKQIQDKHTVKETTKDSYLSDKMSPKENGRVQQMARKRKVGPSVCSACGQSGHKANEGCPFPRKRVTPSVGRGKENKPQLLEWS